jgi:hypothetical protein
MCGVGSVSPGEGGVLPIRVPIGPGGSEESPPWPPCPTRSPDTWRGELSVGFSYTVLETVTFNVGVIYEQNLLFRGRLPQASKGYEREIAFAVGSVQRRGLRPLPLVQLHFDDRVSLDLNAAFGVLFGLSGYSGLTAPGQLGLNLLAGLSYLW